MSSQVAICNMALTKIAAPRITSIDDNTESARLCNALYNIIADEVMSEGPWTSVVTRQTLAQLTDEPEFDFDYMYQLPVNPFCLKVLDVFENEDGLKIYQIEED